MPENEVIHLDSGLIICGKPQSYCGAKFVIDYKAGKVTNGTQTLEKATCPSCLAKHKELKEHAQIARACESSARRSKGYSTPLFVITAETFAFSKLTKSPCLLLLKSANEIS